MTTNQFSLGGTWAQSVGGREIDFVTVPGAFPPIGECTLTHTFDQPWPTDSRHRIFLVTEGVLAKAAFVLNGQPIGEAGPWATYRYELPAGLLKPTGNTLQAHLRDMGEAFGPMPGRRFECGLPRAIYLQRRPATYLASMTFQTELNDEHDMARCSVSVEMDGETPRIAHVILAEKDSGRVVAQGEAQPGQPARFDVEWPRLWSPAAPNMYTLSATLPNSDTLCEQVGIRKLEVRGQDFYLNGERLTLKGVCRHEFTTLNGYAVPEEQARIELARIKHAGFNYIRLVHSPHAPCVPRIAAELGLLVSEEPGTCWHDLSQPAIAAPAVECLLRTVQRDRNVPSIFAFLIYNECNPNVAYAMQQAQACRSISPGCLLGMADCSGQNDAIKAMLHAAELSFYGINC
ncbi:MAG TPA: glycoside hydrolase family 2 TIM barrel-domain containing protein, partial [Anaerolineae bacterium]